MSLTLIEFAKLQQDVNRIVEALLKEIEKRLKILEMMKGGRKNEK